MFMICLNMAEMLELSLLEELDAESLLLLTNYYRDKMERCMCRRSIGKSRLALYFYEIDEHY